MAKSNTKQNALERLFGGQQGRPAIQETPKADKATQTAEAQQEGGRQVEAPANTTARRGAKQAATPKGSTGKQSSRRETVRQSATMKQEARPVPISGYVGRGRYVRQKGELERVTPYIRPDQATALRMAAASKHDPRGKDISQIIQSVLDEAGYNETYRALM